MNPYLLIVVALLLIDYLLGLLIEWLNLRAASDEVPEEFTELYDSKKYAKSQQYLRISTRFTLLQSSIMLPLTLAFILLGGFSWVDGLARSAGFGLIGTGLLFAGIFMLISQIVGLPFSIYDTFVLEERFGFNRTTWKTFLMDRIKMLLLGIALGAPIFAGVLWFFSALGNYGWLVAWGAITVIQLFMLYIAPVVFLPMFNKFIPLEDGELRGAIADYAKGQKFNLEGIYKIDGSRRSTRSNAYFTGFGRWRRIALFDTLIERHSTEELVAVLAHEVGHCKLGHIRKQMVIGTFSVGLMLFILSIFLKQPGLYEAFGLDFNAQFSGAPPIYAAFICFGFLYTPISMLIDIAVSALSRRFEYQADAYAAKTANGNALLEALKKLSVDNLSNLTPHPLKVFLGYSHPPTLARVQALRAASHDASDAQTENK